MTTKRKQPIKPQTYGREYHPVTNQKAPEGKHWVQSRMNGAWVLESIGTPFTSSVSSETYWSS